jgi:DNA modification methylase
MELVPTICVAGLTEAEKRILVLADNRVALSAGWNREMLATELGDLAELLPALNWDLSIIGFPAVEIDNLFADHGAAKLGPEDTVPALPKTAVTREGDIWLLGKHRLMCGDARSSDDADRLMAGAEARMAFCDPPFNVPVRNIVGRGAIKHREFAHGSGEMTEAAFQAFLETTLANAARVTMAGGVHFVCIDWRHVGTLIAAGKATYAEMLNLIAWVKTNAGQGSFYRSQHELIGVFRVGDEPHQNNVQLGRFGRNRTNVWTYPGVNSFGAGRLADLAAHPTLKPVALVADAMRDCTTKGDLVVDFFMGSGTTLLAAEKIGRRACGLECDPLYVDVAIRRWQDYSGCDAVLEDDQHTFVEVEDERLRSDIAAATIVGADGSSTARYGSETNARR